VTDYREVSVGRQDGHAFNVGRDEQGPFVFVRDPKTPRFEVGMQEDGLHVDVLRQPPAPSLWNLVFNPRFHLSATDGWASAGVNASRVTTPPVALPSGYDACALLYYGSGPAFYAGGAVEPELAESPLWAASYDVLAYNGITDVQFVVWYEGGASDESWGMLVPNGQWNRYSGILVPAAPVTWWRLSFLIPSSCDTPAEGIYVTGCRVGPATDYSPVPYRDGDSPGWSWTGTPHFSASRGYS